MTSFVKAHHLFLILDFFNLFKVLSRMIPCLFLFDGSTKTIRPLCVFFNHETKIGKLSAVVTGYVGLIYGPTSAYFLEYGPL